MEIINRLKNLFRRNKPNIVDSIVAKTEYELKEWSLRSTLRSKGMSGDPVICDQCNSVFSNNWDFCDNCGKRKSLMPASSFPYSSRMSNRSTIRKIRSK